MACLLNNDFVKSCCEFALCSTNSDDDNDGEEGLSGELDDSTNHRLWSYDLGAHSVGEFSHAVVQAKEAIEDHSLVEVAGGAIFVGVYNGHGGDAASRFAATEIFDRFNRIAKENRTINEKALEKAYAETRVEFLNHVDRLRHTNPGIKSSGSRCLSAVIWRGTLYVANAGESRVVIGTNCLLAGPCAKQLIKDDSQTQEFDRLQLNISSPYDQQDNLPHESWRRRYGITEVLVPKVGSFLDGRDFDFLRGLNCFNRPLTRVDTSGLPKVHTRTLGRKDRFLIFASIGLWNLISNMKAVTIVNNNLRKGIAKKLIQEALKVAVKKNSQIYNQFEYAEAETRPLVHDDISVVVVFLDREVWGQERPVIDPVRIVGLANSPEPGRFDLQEIH